METSGFRSCFLRRVKSPCELRGSSWDSSPVGAGAYGLFKCWGRNLRFLYSADMDLGVPMEFQRGVRPRIVWRHASQLSSRAVKVVLGSGRDDIGICGFLSRCHRAVTHAKIVLSWFSGWQSSQYRGIRCMWSGLGHQGLFELWENLWSCSQVSSWDRLLLKCVGNAGIPFPMKQGNGPSSRDEEGKTGLFLSCGGTLSVTLESGNFLSCIKGVKDPFEAQGGKWDFSWDTVGERGLISHWEENLLLFLFAAGKTGFLLSYDVTLRDLLVLPQESQVSMRVVGGLSGCSPVGARS